MPIKSTTDFYTLYPDDAHGVVDEWFDAQRNRFAGRDATLKGFVLEEIEALKAFHDRKSSTEEAARAITRPISASPVPPLNTYSDESVALTHLWTILNNAILEWPPHWTEKLIRLLHAMSRIPDHVHQGEATDDEDEKPLTWTCLPWFAMVWSEAHWMTPGQINRRCVGKESRTRAKIVYLKQQDIEAQLVARGLLAWKRAPRYVVKVLERVPDPNDDLEAPNDALAEDQFQADFHIPAVACWIKYNGQRLREDLRTEELSDWDKRDVQSSNMQSERPIMRWTLWMKRLREFERAGKDEAIKCASAAAVEDMEAITK